MYFGFVPMSTLYMNMRMRCYSSPESCNIIVELNLGIFVCITETTDASPY